MRRTTAALEADVHAELRRFSLGRAPQWPDALSSLAKGLGVTPLIYTPSRDPERQTRFRVLASGSLCREAAERGMDWIGRILTYDPWKVARCDRNRVTSLEHVVSTGKMPRKNLER